MKIGTIGTGSIVEAFLKAIENNNDAECVAVYSRKEVTGKSLADKFGIKKVYTSLEDMLDDKYINFIYIASPNSIHFEQTLKALNSGKNVICEKPFTSTVEELEILMDVANEKGLFLFEAITTIYLPNYRLIKDNIKKLGNIKMIQCNYSQYSSKYNALLAGETPNVFNPKFSGGALVDINLYNIHFVMNMFGNPDKITYVANKHENGIDTSGVVVMRYPSFIAECVGCKDTRSVNSAIIQGEKGYIYVHEGANGCRRFTINVSGEETIINTQDNTNNLYYEMNEISKIYKQNDLELCYEILDYSHDVLKAIVEARKDAGIVFNADSL